MRIRYYGHSCFELKFTGGVSILTDPFDETVGYDMPSPAVDIVSISHNHYDHNYTGSIRGEYRLVNKAGDFRISGINITGVPSFHDKFRGAKRGSNIIFTFDDGSVRVCHLGDLGHLLSDGQLRRIGRADVLLIPVGGFYTIDWSDAVKVVGQINPSVVIPMHYKTDAVTMPIDTAGPFIKGIGGAQRIGSREIEIDSRMLRLKKMAYVLEYK